MSFNLGASRPGHVRASHTGGSGAVGLLRLPLRQGDLLHE